MVKSKSTAGPLTGGPAAAGPPGVAAAPGLTESADKPEIIRATRHQGSKD